jgi:CO dehydrogenase nickel-insertion accessory protein CooC1
VGQHDIKASWLVNHSEHTVTQDLLRHGHSHDTCPVGCACPEGAIARYIQRLLPRTVTHVVLPAAVRQLVEGAAVVAQHSVARECSTGLL